jgi:NAD(P)-dependent dehydrogenase (short-subunit alcohol dehydrogenase family)
VKGKVCIVTGASAGIGLVTARELAKKGATVVAVARDPERGAAAVRRIQRESGSESVSLELADMASQKQIRSLAEKLLDEQPRIDVLVNNAGAIQGDRTMTEDGLETTFAVNHLGYFLLTTLLLDRLRASAPARIVNVASEAHRGQSLDFDDLQGERSYSAFGAYGRSKLANILFTLELAKRLEGSGVTANSLHPGVVATQFGQSGHWFMRIGTRIARPFFIGADKGARTSVFLASSPDVEGVSGLYFKDAKPAQPSRQARDADAAQRLWAVSEELVARSA